MKHLVEERLRGETLYNGKILELERDIVRLEDGNEATREVVRHSGGVGIIARDHDDCIYLVKQYRYPHAQITREIPAGKREIGENPEECARRELLEEIGATADRYSYLGNIYPTPAYDSEIIHIYAAEDLHFSEQSLDEGEFLDVERLPLVEAVELVMQGKLPDAKTQIAILKLASQKGS